VDDAGDAVLVGGDHRQGAPNKPEASYGDVETVFWTGLL